MPRPPRIEFPGALHHVVSHGVGSEAIYAEEGDRGLFLWLAGEVAARHGWICHAYCLMTTHYHLLVETPAADLAPGLQRLNGRYAQAFNRVYGRRGHLFEARYKAVLVEKESHLLDVARYVVRNPVRARMCDDPAAWVWSSYRATAGLDPPPPFLTTRWILGHFGQVVPEAQERYRDFVSRSRDDFRVPRRGQVLGSPAFVRRITASRGGQGQTPGSDPGV